MSNASANSGAAATATTPSSNAGQDIRRTVSSSPGSDIFNLMNAASSGAGGGISAGTMGLGSGIFSQPTQQQSQQSGSGGSNGNEVLLNDGNAFASIGNGFGNDGSSNTPGAFDLSDFPSLGVAVASSSRGANGNADGLSSLMRTQHIIAQQQMLPGGSGSKSSAINPGMYQRMAMSNAGGGGAGAAGNNFHMAAEDFPALPGAPQAGLLPDATGGQNSTSYLTNDRSVQPGSGTPVRTSTNFSGDLDVVSGLPNPSSLCLQASQQQQTQPSSSSSNQQHNPHSQQQQGRTATTSSSSGAAGSALSGDYGLLGLLGVIRMSDADRNALALGSDLTTLGLNLNSSEHLYSTFAGPWSDAPTTREPQYQLPMCYYMQPPALKTGHLSKFQLETLFYIFYALPKDVLQAYAAQELYAREWKFHVDLKLWFKRASPADGVPVSTLQYIYFDINTWERRMFNSQMTSNVTNSLLPEDDVRVKFSNS